ncbi:hypothetical protein [Pseudomonas sp. KCJK9016]|uniref:hypothetical protein n=1 Tax=Pseudomonas sp. KCJK9016 TaxID=3344556 RepID=UPI0039066300
MRTLGEIIEAAKSGERPDYDDLRLAVCAMDGLTTFDRQAIWMAGRGRGDRQEAVLDQELRLAP